MSCWDCNRFILYSILSIIIVYDSIFVGAVHYPLILFLSSAKIESRHYSLFSKIVLSFQVHSSEVQQTMAPCFIIYLYLSLYSLSAKLQKNFYIFDDNLPPPLNVTNAESVQNAWNMILSSIIASNISLNTSDPNQFIFNISILSDLDIMESSSIVLPDITNPNDIPITLNINCQQLIACNLNLINTNFITIIDGNTNATKFILYLHSFVINRLII